MGFKFLVSLVVINLVLGWFNLSLPDSNLHIHFLDIGQGDAILIVSPEGHRILIDGGPDSGILEEIGEVLPIYDISFDLIVLTHPDKDHLNGLVEVLNRYEVSEVLLTGVDHSSNYYDEFLELIAEKDVDFIYADDSKDFFVGEKLFFDVIYPFESLKGEQSSNDSSIVMKGYYEDFTFLLTGDIEEAPEEKILEANIDISADLLKVGHHGSKTSTSEDFLSAVNPKYAVVQAGVDNNFGHPHTEVLRRLQYEGVEIYRNDLVGRVEVVR